LKTGEIVMEKNM